MSQDYSGRNLRGRSFKGQNLEGADFSDADLRGTNFTGANLLRANFTAAKAGLLLRWAIFLVMISCLLSGLSGFLFVLNGTLISQIFSSSDIQHRVLGWMTLILTIIVFTIILRRGIGTFALAAFTFPFTLAGAGAFAIAGVITFGGINIGVNNTFVAFTLALTGITLAGTAFALAGAFAFILAGILVFSLTGTVGDGVFALATICGVFALAAVAGTVALSSVAGTLVLAGVGAIISIYIVWRAIKGDEKYTLVRKIAVAFAAFSGTSFHNADLRDADFTRATLKNTDLRKAKLIRTRFYSVKKLDLARVGNSILSDRDVLNLLVSGNGRKKSYAGLNLKGANLIGADLKEVNLKDSDITEATFQGACLEWANLTLSQAVEANFTNALMTGACVEAWNIESKTKLDNVDCRFIYLLENPKFGTDDRERRPSSGEFQPGEFTKLFEEVFNTVDLIFRDGIDWKAFVTAFKKVQVENEDSELAIQSIENKGDGVVVVKVAVPVDTEKEKIHSDFSRNYQLALEEVEKKYKAELQAKDKEIKIYREKSSEMKEIVGLLANRPINNIIDVKQNQGDTNMTGERNIHMGSGNYNERIEGDYNQNSGISQNMSGGTMYGGMQAAQGNNNHQTMDTNVVSPEQQQTLADAVAEIQALLEQLENSYPADTTMGKMVLATEVMAQIENNPNLTSRILSALKISSVKAFEQFLNHPAASFVIGALEDWEKTRGID